jgi:large subunit ribosomal protein L18
MKQTFTLAYKRKRLGKTNYKKRLKLLQSQKPRLVIRKSLSHILMQIITFNSKGDSISIAAHSRELEQYGWKGHKGNIPSAYLTGLLIGKKAKERNITEAILDSGLQKLVKGSRIYAGVKGCRDAGIKVPADNNIFPDNNRLNGTHIVNCAKNAPPSARFSTYQKKNIDVTILTKLFEDVKQKIVGA